MNKPYPESRAQRNRWVLAQRGAKNLMDPWRPYAFLWEEEYHADGSVDPTATVFLTNRECPFRCLMCDLWRNTLDTTVPLGAIPTQIRHALEHLPPARMIKLYNAGNFFDPGAIPPQDYDEIAEIVRPFARVIVESHPAFLGERCLRFRDLLAGRLEVAVGLETAHPEALAKLNKGITVESFGRAAGFLARNGISLRVFLMLRPPFLSEEEGVAWARRSLDVAFDCGAEVCCVIPTRGGNGAMEALTASGDFTPPSLRSLEVVVEYGLALQRGRVYADLWDIERLHACACSTARVERLERMNRTQRVAAPVVCALCDGETHAS